MTRRAKLRVEVPVAAPPEAVWAAVTDWPRQSEWILGTRVSVAEGDGRSVGSRIDAYTGRKPVGFLDTMVVTGWEPPHRVEVLHDGKLLRGPGVIEVQARGAGSLMIWWEDLEQPLGALGAVGWLAAKPLVRAGFRQSLGKLALAVEREARGA